MFNKDVYILEMFGSFLAVWFLSVALTFLLPACVFTLVMEKQERLLEMMKIVSEMNSKPSLILYTCHRWDFQCQPIGVLTIYSFSFNIPFLSQF